jgi:hypothetical protein
MEFLSFFFFLKENIMWTCQVVISLIPTLADGIFISFNFKFL